MTESGDVIVYVRLVTIATYVRGVSAFGTGGGGYGGNKAVGKVGNDLGFQNVSANRAFLVLASVSGSCCDGIDDPIALVVTECADAFLCYQYRITYGAFFALSKTVFGAGGLLLLKLLL